MSQCVNIDCNFPFVITTFVIPIYEISCTVLSLLHNKTRKRDHFEWQNETFSNFFWTVNGMKYHKYSKYLLSIWIQYINFLYHFWTKVENICTLKRASATYKSYLFTDNVWLIHCTGVRQSGNQMFSTWVVYTKDFSIEGFFFSGLLGLL